MNQTNQTILNKTQKNPKINNKIKLLGSDWFYESPEQKCGKKTGFTQPPVLSFSFFILLKIYSSKSDIFLMKMQMCFFSF